MEHGSLDFAIRYADAICKLYDAIGYVPPRGDRKTRITNFEECTSKGVECAELLQQMQEECEKRFPGRSTFMGPDGMPWSKTIECVVDTIKSWKVLSARVESIIAGSSQDIYPPSVTSEHNVEHSFGFVGKKGQGNNQSQQEYIAAKRSHAVDFQLRMCKMHFCQSQKSKIRDKGYQELEGDRVSLSVEDLKEIFGFCEKQNTEDDENNDITEEDAAVIQKAFLLSKSVPRQTNRAKHREKSGYEPNMLLDHCGPGKILKNDLVCTQTIADEIMYLIVQKDVLLDNQDVQIPVTKIGDSSVFNVTYDKLLTDMAQIICIPPQLYETIDHEVVLNSTVMPMNDILCKKGRSDEEWAVLMETEQTDLNTSLLPEVAGGKKRKADAFNIMDNENNERGVKFRKVGLAVDEDGESRVDDADGTNYTENDNALASPSCHLNITPVDENVTPSQFTPHQIGELVLDKWVIVRLKHNNYWEYYIGQVTKIEADGAKVRCLEHAYGVSDPQDFEKERFWKKYPIGDIFISPVIPISVAVGRTWKWKY